MAEEFNGTVIVDTTLQPKALRLSPEAEAAVDSVVTIDEARRLLEQTGYGYLANIPLMYALCMGGAPDSPYHIDYTALLDVFAKDGERMREKIQRSYDEVVGMTNMGDAGNMQGVKELGEYKKRLCDSLQSLGVAQEYATLREVVRLYVQYLQTAYILIGRQH